ncbi:MAG TPA: DHA2 family efflux MFS transporter permease subunit [Ktedonobacterales bacterium]|jgi:DHA2 family multidrug resistance protein
MRLDYKWRAAVVVALGLFMGVLDVTIVSVALPQMRTYFHTDVDTITWVATAYLLAQAAVIPITGFISDRIGTKTVFLTALALFTIGSGLCAIAPTEQWLIAFRVLQGIGGGALFPVAFAIIFRIFPPDERGPASALIGVPVLLAPAFGPTIGGYFTQAFDWRAIFLINLPVGVIAFIGCFVVLHGGARERTESGLGEPAARRRFDVVGLVLSVTGFTTLVYGITEASTYGWNDHVFQHFQLGGLALDMSVLRYLILGGVLLVAFAINELLVSDPVMDIRLFRNYTFMAANVLIWVVSGFLFASIYLLPIFFQNVQNYSPLQSGEFVIIQGLGAAIATVIAGRFYNSIGPRWLVAFGFVLVTAGTYGLTMLTVGTSWQSLQVWLLVRGLGLGFTNIPLQTLALSVVSNRAMARASSLVNVTRQAFGAVGITALITIFAQQTTDYATSHAAQVQAATTAYVTQQVQAATQQAVQQYTSGSALDPTTPLGKLVATCAQPFGHAAQQHAAQIQACVQQAAQHYGQQFAQTYAAQHAHQLGVQFAQSYAAQHLVPVAQTYGINVAFVVSMVGCAVSIVLALFLGQDPAVKAAREAKARGEVVASERPAILGE